MQTHHWFKQGIGRLVLAGLALLLISAAQAQTRPYIGYAYPAGGQQGATFQVRLGGQNMDDVEGVRVSGEGVKATVVEYYRRLNPQEMQVLGEQARILKKSTSAVASAMAPMMKSEPAMMASEPSMMMMSAAPAGGKPAAARTTNAAQAMLARIDTRVREFVQTPACASISSLVIAEVTIAPDAAPGPRELRLTTLRGVSNPLVFHVGQVPEFTRPAMITASIQVLGKEASALRKRPTNEVEMRVTSPCTVNGQIASGEVNRYRFSARKGQRLVFSTQARQLIPYVADAVPGWFQPVLTVHDARGKEMAYADDYRFRPDPVILFETPKDGDYVFAINDAIYRGREDFVYRITVGELPFVTSLFPLGGQAGVPVAPRMKGWNLQGAVLSGPAKDTPPGVCMLVAKAKGLVSNPIPFAVDTLPGIVDGDATHTLAVARKITLPIVINGRIDRPDDWDVFQFVGKSNETVAVEVQARRLDSPLDSVIKLTDAAGTVLAFNDDHEDLAAGASTHHADSWFMARLPADGRYFVHIGDTARQGGDEYAYRLRVSAPQPDFELRVVPSSVSMRTNSTATLTVYAARKDGFTGPVKLALSDPPPGFSAAPVTLAASQNVARIVVKGPSSALKDPVSLSITGAARPGLKQIVRTAVPAEDRMQAFLWRHLVPASELKVLVFDPGHELPPKRIAPARPALVEKTNAVAVTNAAAPVKAVAATNALLRTNAVAGTNSATGTNVAAAPKPKFTKQQVARRLRELKLLFEEGLLTPEFYTEKADECETGY